MIEFHERKMPYWYNLEWCQYSLVYNVKQLFRNTDTHLNRPPSGGLMWVMRLMKCSDNHLYSAVRSSGAFYYMECLRFSSSFVQFSNTETELCLKCGWAKCSTLSASLLLWQTTVEVIAPKHFNRHQQYILLIFLRHRMSRNTDYPPLFSHGYIFDDSLYLI